MDEFKNESSRPVNPRRRRRTKMDIFKESYLPVIIVGIALLFIIITVIGSIVQGAQRKKIAEQEALDAAIAQQELADRLAKEAASLLTEASYYASSYNYDQAIQIINRFSGNIAEQPQLSNALQQYEQAKTNAVAWSDPSQVLNLSFQLLRVAATV